MSDSASVDAALATVESELGPVDVWVNNAGIQAAAQAARIKPEAEAQHAEAAATGTIETGLDALVRLPDDEWRRMLAVHLDGTFFGTRAAARSMAPRRSGAIVNIASVCGLEGCTGYPHYSAAKAGIIGFTQRRREGADRPGRPRQRRRPRLHRHGRVGGDRQSAP